jgi:hypothetical protein
VVLGYAKYDTYRTKMISLLGGKFEKCKHDTFNTRWVVPLLAWYEDGSLA